MAVNQILARLSTADAADLQGSLKPFRFEQGAVLYEAGAKIDYSFFPLQGSLSAVVVMLDGRMIEVATVGNEGAVGLPMPVGAAISANRVLVQVPGEGLRIQSRLLEKKLQSSARLQDLFGRYQSAYQFQISQSVACNGLHSLRERCCRWLLMTHDRADADEIKLTHEFLAVMLGVRRPGVTETLQELQESGLLTYSRGSITIANRDKLEAQSCECYRTVRDEYAKLMG
ncbi:Crp/Fnr family transcriptional regulator [Anatilimnocola floriformis]|uniref:Crp/Fnr family transcriptional regulator n=1 Tax=Anatilimnocola floriformis TaxID=2948575 RepID=UPI0020C53DDD|nr:Crp/Fnr family transcriptional regulator [Anatilimnocola floriformis]